MSDKKAGVFNRRVECPQWLWAAVLLTALVVLVFGQVVQFEFMSYDDIAYITDNAYMGEGVDWQYLKSFFSPSFVRETQAESYWKPLYMFSKMLDVELFGFDPHGHHLTNLILHCLNVFLCFIFLRLLTGTLWRSLAAAAVFAVHPLQAEPVAWVTGRVDVLCGFWVFLTLICYVQSKKSGKRIFYFSSLICYSAALMSKPHVVVLPFILMLLDYWPFGLYEGKDKLGQLKRSFLKKWMFWTLACAGAYMVNLSQPGHLGQYEDIRGMLGVAALAYSFYIKKFFYPVEMTLYSFWKEMDIGLWEAGLGIGAVLLLTLLALLLVRKKPHLFTGWLWYLIFLAPSTVLARPGDRYNYLSVIGIAVFLLWGCCDWVAKFKSLKKPAVCLVLIGVMLLAFKSAECAGQWKTNQTLMSRCLEINPNNKTCLHSQAMVHLSAGRAGKAVSNLTQIIDDPIYTVRATCGLADICLRTGRLKEAGEMLEHALSNKWISDCILFSYGDYLLQTGKPEEALEYYHKGALQQPDSVAGHEAYIKALIALGKSADAEIYMNEVVIPRFGRKNKHVSEWSELMRLSKLGNG